MECVTLPILIRTRLAFPLPVPLMFMVIVLPNFGAKFDKLVIVGRVAYWPLAAKRYGGSKIWPSAWSTDLSQLADEPPTVLT